ncbi:MAG: hypothetical protein LBV80_07650 [Deltaproteobacteria bacterium]|jgi:hypothetical protein|nr:hypothetical protein [Deltaproteobacteria bacterium]
MKKGDIIWGSVLAIISLALVIPDTREAFVQLTVNYSYPMSFLKFAVLAIMGELLAIRITSGDWLRPKGVVAKALTWGIFGMVISLSFGIYSGGVLYCMSTGYLPAAAGFIGALLTAFFISLTMNVSFGPIMMATHRITDTYIDRKVDRLGGGVHACVEAVDWISFIKFVVFKTIPRFWIPAHTLVFLLPPEFRVLAAAYLSIALGGLMAIAKKKAASK